MGKTTIEQNGNKYVVLNRLSKSEAVNERVIIAISEGLLDSLIPVVLEKKKKEKFVKCSVSDMIPLKTYFTGIVNKKMFLDVVLQIVCLIKECDKSLMNSNNFDLETDKIFIDPKTKAIKCIFWPIVNNQSEKLVSQFLKEIPFLIVFSKHEDNGYISEYIKFFKNTTPFSINSFEKLILELSGKTVESTHTPSGTTTYGGYSKDTSSNNLKGETGNTIAYNPFENVIEKKTDDNNNIEDEDEKEDDEGTSVLGAESYSGGTTVLGADEEEIPAFPYLIRVKTDENISVNKPSFRIGKERKYSDYFVSDNNAVSRSHADIITREHRYYIVDNNSVNKTYVDNRAIPINKEIEIFPGTKIRLANEDFIFYI